MHLGQKDEEESGGGVGIFHPAYVDVRDPVNHFKDSQAAERGEIQ